nr:hypothetical protein GCM10025699_57060 [Microbacterium flavescens]
MSSSLLDNPRSPRVRAVAKLAKGDARTETGLFLLEGPQSVSEALAFRPELLVDLFVTPTALERHPQVAEAAREADLDIEFVSEAVIAAMADTVTPRGSSRCAGSSRPRSRTSSPTPATAGPV